MVDVGTEVLCLAQHRPWSCVNLPIASLFGTCINGTGHECWSFTYDFWFLYEGSLHVVVVVITLEA